MQKKSLIEFPCSFTLKIMGRQDDSFVTTIEELIKSEIQNFSREQIKTRPSSQNNYIAITAEVYVYSQTQLDDLYRLLSAHPLVLFVL